MAEAKARRGFVWTRDRTIKARGLPMMLLKKPPFILQGIRLSPLTGSKPIRKR